MSGRGVLVRVVERGRPPQLVRVFPREYLYTHRQLAELVYARRRRGDGRPFELWVDGLDELEVLADR